MSMLFKIPHKTVNAASVMGMSNGNVQQNVMHEIQ